MTADLDVQPTESGPGGPLLSVVDVSQSYRRRPVLSGVSLDVYPGEVVALVGENGTGKSTMLRLCAGLLAPDSGDVRRRGRLGYCPQTPGLMDLLTAGEHLTLFDRAPSLHAVDGYRHGMRVLQRLGFPLAEVDTTLAKQLSGGTAQKLNLALAMLGDADVLLLDEPYQGFDQGSYVNFWDFAEQWRAAGMAVLVVTHMLSELSRVDRVVELSQTTNGSVLRRVS